MSSRAVSIKEVAERAGVALGTVSNVLNRPESVSLATRERVLTAITELGYVRNDAARQLRAGKSRTLGLVLLNVGNPFFTDISRAAEDRALQQNLLLLLGNSDGSVQREAAYLDLFEQRRVLGLLITPVSGSNERLTRLRDRGTPMVMIDQHSEDPEISSVSVDDVAGGRAAASHLIDQGCRRLMFVGGPFSQPGPQGRLDGCRSAVAESGRSPVVSLEVVEAEMTMENGRRFGAELSRRSDRDRPDGVLVANDLMAVGLLQAVLEAGRPSVPNELAVIGYDDIGLAGMTGVPLSSVRQPSQLMGSTAVDLLLAEVAAAEVGRPADHRQVIFQPELVVRASSRRRPAERSPLRSAHVPDEQRGR